MIHLLGAFWRGLRSWERPARLALLLGAALFVPLLLLWLVGPMEWRRASLAGLCGLGLGLQVVFLWAQRGLLSDWSRAQQLYLDGEFEAACELLEGRRSAGRADQRMLTLLGNALRQRGMLAQSETVLREALAQRPGQAFPLTGLARTLLADGRYADAVEVLREALGAGAPDVVRLDLGEALYHAGKHEEAREALQTGLAVSEEPGRRLIGQYLLYQLGAADPPDAQLRREGRLWLEAQAQRFAHREYGRALAAGPMTLFEDDAAG